MRRRVFLAMAVILGVAAGCAVRTAHGASGADSLELSPFPQDKKSESPPLLPAGVRLFADLEYARPGGRSLLLDLYVPPHGAKPAPIILWVHGGGWDMGDRHDRTAVPLAGFGYAVASIDYRLSQQATFPAQIEDCKAAVRWLRAHGKDFNLDVAHIGAWGASAGGHLVALLGTSGGVNELEGYEGNLELSSRVQAVCDWFGPTDQPTTSLRPVSRRANHGG